MYPIRSQNMMRRAIEPHKVAGTLTACGAVI